MKAKEKEVKVKTEKTFLYKGSKILRKNTTPFINEKDVPGLKGLGLISEIKSKEVYSKKVVEPKEVYDIKNVSEITSKEIQKSKVTQKETQKEEITSEKIQEKEEDKDEIKFEKGFYIIPGGKRYKSKRGAKKAMARRKTK